MTDRKDDPLKQPLLAGEEHHPDSGLFHLSPDGGVGGHPSSTDHSRHSVSQDEEQAEPLLPKSKPNTGHAYDSLTSVDSRSGGASTARHFASSTMPPGQGIPQPDGSVLPSQDEEQAEPLLPKSKPNTGPAYDSLTSVDSRSGGASTARHFASSTMPPGQGIPQPDGSVLPVDTTPAIRLPLQPPPSQYYQHLPPKQGAAVAGPAPQTTGMFSEQYGSSYLPMHTDVTTGDAPQAGPIPPKRGATSGPAPDSSFHTAPIPSKQGVTSGPAPPMGSMPPPPPSSAVSGPAPTYTNPSGPYDPVMRSQPLSSPTSHMPQRQLSVTGYDNQQRFPPAPYAPRPGSPQPLPMQYPSYQQQQPVPPAFPSSQYRPYRPPPPPQPTVTVVQMPATSYMPYQDQRQPQQGAVVQQPKPRLPVKTSFKFDLGTLDDNHFYIALCLLICVIVCFNPLGLVCTIPALVFACKAARANEQDSYEEARKYHKRAQFCNIGTGAAIVTAGVSSVAVVIYLFVFLLTFSTSSTV